MIDANRIKHMHLDGMSQRELAKFFNVSRKTIQTVLYEYGLGANPSGRKLVDVKGVILSDLHVPYHDKKAVNIALEFIKSYAPDELIINGDFIDNYTISFFNKGKPRKISGKKLIDEINEAKDMLRRIEAIIPKDCKKIFLHGNHDNVRWERVLDERPELEGLLNYEEILKGWEQYDYMKQYVIGDTLVSHGSLFNKYYANKNAEELKMNCIQGHAHRSQVMTVKKHGGTIKSYGSPCLCVLTPHYKGKYYESGWDSGFIRYEIVNGATFASIMEIKDGMLVYNGEVFGG